MLSLCCFPAWLTFQPWRLSRNATPKRRFCCNELHDVISQKIKFLLTTVVRNSNPAYSSHNGSFSLFFKKRKMTRNVRYIGKWRQKICGRRSVNVFKMQNEFSTRDNCVYWGSMSWQFQSLSLDSVGNFNARRGLCNWNVFWIYSSLQNIGNTQQPT